MSQVEGQSSAGHFTTVDDFILPGNHTRMEPPYDYNPNFKPAKGILKQRSRILQREQQASASWISTLNSKLSGNQNTNANDSQKRNGTDQLQDGKTADNRPQTGLAGGLSGFRKFISNAASNRTASNAQGSMMNLENSSVTSLSSLTSENFEDSNLELDPEELKRVRFSIQQLTTEYRPYDNPQYVDDAPKAEETNELKVGTTEDQVAPATLEVSTEVDPKVTDETAHNFTDITSHTESFTETTFEEVTPNEQESPVPKRSDSLVSSLSSGQGCSPNDLLVFYETACRNKDEHMFQPLVRQLQEQAHMAHLTSLDLSNYLIDREAAEPISDILTLEHNIQRLIMQNCGLEDETIKLMLNGLLTSDSIKYLNIANNKKIKANGYKFIAIYMRESTSLQVLNLSLNNFDKKSVQMISQGLLSKKSNAGLDTLIMDACLFRPSLLEALAVGVKNTASLKTLSLRNNRINHQGASWIGVMLRDYVSLGFYAGSTESISSTSSIQHGLERLALDGNDLRQGIQFVAQALKRNQSLKELGLNGCKIDARSAVYLGDALKYNQALEKLNISNNDLGIPVRDGFSSLSLGLQHHPSLRDIDLKGTSMKTEEISKSLPYVKSLMRLDLRNNPHITIEGYASLAEAMKRNHTLAFLDIDVSQANQELTQLQSEILTQCSHNTRRNFAETTDGEDGSIPADTKVAPHKDVERVVSKTKAQATVRLSLQERLAAVTRGANSRVPVPSQPNPSPSPEEELREKLEARQKEEESLHKEIEIASDHQSLLAEMLNATSTEPSDERSDVNETLDVSYFNSPFHPILSSGS
ncbi:hypothetical protein BC943DRAFT_18415 [Umbelopsis sp. AD052]|nr:hypothetical protein BC943DRAFT_18415 [Umbelopsis sp. AD052]